MASLQSSRTQCCCCAVGVFAALFGIIMLSAGICIVLNVNYMEVDTSGLPPELHNEDGKRVVGIILICVAIGSLGLSTTVSIIYFAMCNDTPRRTVLKATSTTGGLGTEGATNGGSRAHPALQSNRLAAPNHRAPDGQRNSSGSQHSLNSLPRRRPSPSLTPVRTTTGVRKKVQKGKNHRIRHTRYQTGLAPHIEEPETAKSQVDLKLHHGRSADTPSDSHANLVHEHPSTSHTVNETQQMASASGSSFSAQPVKSGMPPVIVINGSYSTNLQHGALKSPSSEALDDSVDLTGPSMSFFDANTVGGSVMLTEESTLFDETDTDEPSNMHFHSNVELQQSSSDLSRRETNQFINRDVDTNHPHPIPSSDTSESTPQQERCHPVAASPDSMLPPRVDVIDEGEQSSLDSSSFNVVQVLSINNSNSDITAYHQSVVEDKNQRSHEEGLEKDQNSELPPSSRHHEMYADLNDNNSDRRCESRSSFNSGFSNDGGDPDGEDMKKIHENMRELLQ